MRDESSPRVKYSIFFDKQFRALPLTIKLAFREARELFLNNPNNPILRDHALKEKFQGYRSIDVTEDYRAIYKRRVEGRQELITFYMIGTHEKLYGKQK